MNARFFASGVLQRPGRDAPDLTYEARAGEHDQPLPPVALVYPLCMGGHGFTGVPSY